MTSTFPGVGTAVKSPESRSGRGKCSGRSALSLLLQMSIRFVVENHRKTKEVDDGILKMADQAQIIDCKLQN